MENETISGKRILLVDDEGLVRESVKGLLARDEHIVVEANNGAEAFCLFTQDRFDLVLTDCIMPFVSGDELAMRIRKLAPRQPILMITGNGFRRGPRNPVDAVLDKPFDYEDLQQKIAELLPQSPTTTALV
jgi:CheY-like chemotaxis protein